MNRRFDYYNRNFNNIATTMHSITIPTTEMYVSGITSNDMILNSITEGSTKRFRITVDDSGTLTAVEVTE